MHPVAQDIRRGAYLLWNAPGFTIAALAALALGMGAAAAISSVVDAVLLKPLPFPHPDRLLVIWEKNPAQNKFKQYVAGGNFLEWQKQSRTLAALGAFQDNVHVNLTAGPNGHIEPEELAVQRISAGLFPLLGVSPVVGRGFQPDEDQPGRTNFVLLSFQLWQTRFSANPSIAGKVIRLRDQDYTVVGVMPARFQILDAPADVWIPLGLDPADPRVATGRFLVVIGRLAPGSDISGARAEMETIGNRLAQANPALNRGRRPSVYPLQEEVEGEVRKPLLVLTAAVASLLLIGCVNVANLLLARGAARRKEIAIRSALGASRRRIVAQLVLESLPLALAGGALGLLLAWGGVALLPRLGKTGIPRLAQAQLDWRVFLFALAASLAVGFLFSLAPALRHASTDPMDGLIEGTRGGTASRSGRALSSTLVVSETALAVLILIGAGLLMRSFTRLRAVAPGFQPSGLLTLRVPLSGIRNSSPDRRVAFVKQATSSVGALPGVRAVGAVNALPLTGLGVGSFFSVEGRPAPPPEERPSALLRAVTPQYFRAMGIPLIAGREFAESDTAQAPFSLVIDQTLARRFWPGGANPLGARLALDLIGRVGEIVGIAGDVKPDRLDGEPWPTVYCPHAQYPFSIMVFAVRTALPPQTLSTAVERAIHQLDPDQPVTDIRPMENVLDQAVAGARFNTVILGVFAQIALVLAAVGIYGVVSYDVSRRANEIGVRMALGAHPGNVLWLILRQGALLAAAGLAAGLAAAFALTRLMATMLYGVKPADAGTFAAVSLVLGTVSIMANYLPARRAMALEPAAALRHE
ncbi:MAG TPA: ABC transporter permease [Bryobacteraceae bacterium]|nr:ABC transporter permease [Bryobacteraceae bacterium]